MKVSLIFLLLVINLPFAVAQDFEFQNYNGTLDVDVILAEDHDQDGDLDLLTVGFNSGEDDVYIIDNDGTGTFTFVEKVIMDDVDIRWPKFGDLNGDGLSDMVFSQFSNNEIFVLLNTGQGNYEKQSLEIFNVINFSMMDWEGDGDIDLFGINTDESQVFIFENMGNLNFEEAMVIDLTYDDIEDYAIGDINEDGIVDIAYLGEPAFFESSVDILLSDAQNNYTHVQLADEFGGENSVSFEDIDNDSKIELVAHRSSELRAFHFMEGSDFEATEVISNSSISSFKFGNLNNDNRPDIVVGFNQSDVLLYTNSSLSPISYTESVIGTVFPAFTPNIGDFDGDGKNDIAILSLFDLAFFKNEGMTTSTIDEHKMSDVNVFPNPFHHRINITSDNRQNLQFQIYNLNNQLLVSTKENSIELQDLASGVFILAIEDKETLEIKRIKLIRH